MLPVQEVLPSFALASCPVLVALVALPVVGEQEVLQRQLVLELLERQLHLLLVKIFFSFARQEGD